MEIMCASAIFALFVVGIALAIDMWDSTQSQSNDNAHFSAFFVLRVCLYGFDKYTLKTLRMRRIIDVWFQLK